MHGNEVYLVVLAVCFILSLLANAYQWYRWHTYRSKPSGNHSFTGIIPIQRKTTE